MLGQLLRQVDGPVLAPGASERHHQVLEPTPHVGGDALIYQRLRLRKIPAHALFRVEEFGHRRVLPSEFLEALLASRIRQAAGIECESTAVASCILRRTDRKSTRLNSS